MLSITRVLHIFGCIAVLAAMCASQSWAHGRTAVVRHDADPQLRVQDAALQAAVTVGLDRSATFRDLVRRIAATDGIVYVTSGTCGFGVRSCLAHTVTSIGCRRVLRVVIDEHAVDAEAIASLAHELAHALEVLSNPTVRTHSQIVLLYEQIGYHVGLAVETSEAIALGRRVRRELQARPATTPESEK